MGCGCAANAATARGAHSVGGGGAGSSWRAARRAPSRAGRRSGWRWRGRWCCSPDALLLDEPTANLDPYNVGMIEQIVRGSTKNTGDNDCAGDAQRAPGAAAGASRAFSVGRPRGRGCRRAHIFRITRRPAHWRVCARGDGLLIRLFDSTFNLFSERNPYAAQDFVCGVAPVGSECDIGRVPAGDRAGGGRRGRSPGPR
jgi:hypothetical protein